ncbi:MAG: hypothetical protein ACRCW2_06595 [Cellulosilyticaceae bacterium]
MRTKCVNKFVIMLLILCISAPNIWADTMFTSYTYSYWGELKEAPEAYTLSNTVTGETLGCGAFEEPRSVFVKDELIYIVDSGNNRIVICDQAWNLVRTIEEVRVEGQMSELKDPYDIFVDDKGLIYIADTGNNRILVVNDKDEAISVITKPESELISASIKFEPVKIVVDRAGRIYVIARNMNQGIVELDASGTFTGYVGASKVTPDIADVMWKKIGTKEQKSRMELFVPTEFNNIFIDHKGFLYVTTDVIDPLELAQVIQDRDDSDKVAPVKKFNSMGVDILKRNGHFPPVGDVIYRNNGTYAGPSQIVDVVVDQNDIYSMLDAKRGRIFTYDFEGNLLYVFGEMGNKTGTFKNPIAIEKVGNRIIVVDLGLNRISEFKPTTYGTTINEALAAYKLGDYDGSAVLWEKVLGMNANYDLAYAGMGRAAYRNGDFEKALQYFKLANNNKGYSKAYKFYRKEVIEENFTWIMLGVIAASSAGIWLHYYRKKRRMINGHNEDV